MSGLFFSCDMVLSDPENEHCLSVKENKTLPVRPDIFHYKTVHPNSRGQKGPSSLCAECLRNNILKNSHEQEIAQDPRTLKIGSLRGSFLNLCMQPRMREVPHKISLVTAMLVLSFRPSVPLTKFNNMMQNHTNQNLAFNSHLRLQEHLHQLGL